MTAIGAAARAIIEVRAGVIPEKPIADFTRQWHITSAEWDKVIERGRGVPGALATDYVGVAPQAELLLELHGKAQAYAAYLMTMPDLVNWVRTEWVWL